MAALTPAELGEHLVSEGLQALAALCKLFFGHT